MNRSREEMLAERCDKMREYRKSIYNTDGDGVDVLLKDCAAALRTLARENDGE